MSAVTITIAIGSLVCAGMALVVYVQAREKAKIQKVRMVSTLNDRYHNIQLILSDMPPQYMDNNLRVILHEQCIRCLQELGKLKPSPKHAAYIAESEQNIKELREKNPKFPAAKLDSAEKTKEVRVHLQNLYKLMHLWHRKGTLDQQTAQQYIQHIAFLARQSKADLFAEKARQAADSQKPRVAIHNYHSAIEALKEFASHPVAAQNIAHYRAQMVELNKVADKRAIELKEKAKAKMETNEKWDEFLTDDNEWQKKNDYDD